MQTGTACNAWFAIATCISDIPFDGPCATTQIGLIDGEFVVNPSQTQWQEGDLQLTVASTRQKVIMIEAGANEIPEAKMIEAIYMAHDINQTIIDLSIRLWQKSARKAYICKLCRSG